MATSSETGAHLGGYSNESRTGPLAGQEVHTQFSDRESLANFQTTSMDDKQRQRTLSNSRVPLSTISVGQRNNSDASKPTQGRMAGSKTARTDTGAKSAPFTFDQGDTSLTKSERYDDIPENMYRPEKSDREGWIHREKLAKIESEELQVAGINLAKARSRSRDALGERLRPGGTVDDPQAGSRTNLTDDKPPKTVSVDVDGEEDEDRQNWDFRTPEEIAAEQVTGYPYVSPVLRKSGSKIPILTSNPTPIPAERYERETPMPRKRTMSGTLAPDDSLVVPESRGGNVDGGAAPTASASSSPTKSRSKSTGEPRPATSSGTKPGMTARKASAPVKAAASSSTSNGKPAVRGSDLDRPRTATNRPEGDPPWLATMYKSDPMLPPDQQMLPTLARKQQQEQWALTGQAPAVYDRNFNPLAVYRGEEIHRETTKDSHLGVNGTEIGRPISGDGVTPWPLRTSSNPTEASSPIKSNPSPDSNPEAVGYSTTPQVEQHQRRDAAPSPNIGPSAGDRGSKRLSGVDRHRQGGPSSTTGEQALSNTSRLQVTRMQQATEKEDEELDNKKGGCCCIVM